MTAYGNRVVFVAPVWVLTSLASTPTGKTISINLTVYSIQLTATWFRLTELLARTSANLPRISNLHTLNCFLFVDFLNAGRFQNVLAIFLWNWHEAMAVFAVSAVVRILGVAFTLIFVRYKRSFDESVFMFHAKRCSSVWRHTRITLGTRKVENRPLAKPDSSISLGPLIVFNVSQTVGAVRTSCTQRIFFVEFSLRHFLFPRLIMVQPRDKLSKRSKIHSGNLFPMRTDSFANRWRCTIE